MRTVIYALLTTTALCILLGINVNPGNKTRKKPRLPDAGIALSTWYAQRCFPDSIINMSFLTESFLQMKQTASRTTLFPGTWEAIGPMNFGGRTLALCFNPLNPNTIFAGSASGGLWKSYSAGTGSNAWHQVETGFPLLGVAAIAMNPTDSNEIFIGTGEVYNDQNTGTGFAVRTTRGTYGIGILKSSDGGLNWSKSLDWQYDELKGVQDIIINPINPSTIFAATTEGTFRSFDSGQNWNIVQPSRMATDLLMMPGDTSRVFIAAGNSFSSNPGIFQSVNGGNSFVQITNGLPSTYSGKAMLDVCISNPQVLYASIADQLAGLGLYRSDDSGISWYQANNTDYQTYQGWYSHDVIVKPNDENVVITSGIDVWKSDDGGAVLNEITFWYNWDFSATTVGGPEGPPDYVHADIHRMYYHPLDNNIIYLATDGGVFRSLDGGNNYEGCNGNYHTQQFYANFSCSTSDSLFAIGGMQDNATAVYEGNPGWRRVVGGDGLSTAIHPTNDQIVYGSSQFLNVEQSFDHAINFNYLNIPGQGSNPTTNFAGPFVLSPSNPNILFAGRDIVYKSTDGGQNWNPTNGNNPLDSNPVLALEIADNSSLLVYASTAPQVIPQVGLFRTTNGGTSWTNVMGTIPNRYIMDIAINPDSNNTVFVGLSGFGTPHVFRSVNGGISWSSFGAGLPDVPVNTIAIDPDNTSIMYLGNDIGVYVSIDAGQNWQPFNEGLIDGTFVMDISVAENFRKLRLATHGKGVYERPMLPVTITGINPPPSFQAMTLSPNPAQDYLNIELENFKEFPVLKIYNTTGLLVKEILTEEKQTIISLNEFSACRYFIIVDGESQRLVKSFLKL